MSPAPNDLADLIRLEDAFREAGFRVTSAPAKSPDAQTPWRFGVRDSYGLETELIVYLWPLRYRRWRLSKKEHAGIDASGSEEVREFLAEDGAITLLLGYDAVRDVFVSWPYASYRSTAALAAAWIPLQIVAQAQQSGSAAVRVRRRRLGHPRRARVTAFRRDRMGDCVRAARGSFERELRVERAFRLRITYSGNPFSERPLPSPAAAAPAEPAAPAELAVPTAPPTAAETPAATPPAATAPSAPVVGTGFAPMRDHEAVVDPAAPLAVDSEYWFWFTVGAQVPGSIERTPSSLPDLPLGTGLTVQLFEFPEELRLIGPSSGELEISGEDGAVRVVRAAGQVRDRRASERGPLLFAVRTPACEGVARLRCNVYLGATLVQSRLISCQIGERVAGEGPALSSELDYALSDSLSLERLSRVPPHDLSMMVNGSAESHEFRFYGADGGERFAKDASLDAAAIERAIETARGALRQAAWGTREEWNGDLLSYKYADGDREHFADDLIELARRGRQLYFGIASKLMGGAEGRRELEQLARQPGRVQIAAAGGSLYVPAGLFYDHRLEVMPGSGEGRRYRLCEAFVQAMHSEQPLAELACFADGCASAEDDYSVCPSGFWGYRHEIGWPVGKGEPLCELPYEGRPRLAIGVSTDPLLQRGPAHIKRILEFGDGAVADSRAELTDLLRGTPNLVYLYCHGGVSKSGEPFVELGDRGSDGAITGVYLMNEEVWWEEPLRPIVFINGCHTTALEPKQIADLVSGFVVEANAVGVIGTELTVFEPLACAFSETMLELLLDGSSTVGGAIRHSRLALLKDRNPLGLLYVPFIAAATRFAPRSTP